jgi:hypothetical protein
MLTGRNEKCSCGSGKKFKKCCLGKVSKPRTTTITMTYEEPVTARGIEILPTGEVVLLGVDRKPLPSGRGFIERSYARPKGRKVLSKTALREAGPINISADRALLNFDTIFALDTNTREINGRRVSVASIVRGQCSTQDGQSYLFYAPIQCIEFRDIDPDCHPDLLAVKTYLSGIESDPEFPSIGKVALIIDSHLGNLEAINARELPILDNFFLPKYVTLVYATDAAVDCIQNKLLRECDRHANLLLTQIENGEWFAESVVPFNDHSNYIRFWEL